MSLVVGIIVSCLRHPMEYYVDKKFEVVNDHDRELHMTTHHFRLMKLDTWRFEPFLLATHPRAVAARHRCRFFQFVANRDSAKSHTSGRETPLGNVMVPPCTARLNASFCDLAHIFVMNCRFGSYCTLIEPVRLHRLS